VIVVFDSGIWVSAMEFGGTPLEAVIRAIAQDRFAVCDQIEEEVVRVLTRKFGWEAERVRADLAFYWLDALRVELHLPRSQRPTDSRMRRTRAG
jgi:predicted nucleic acid-binding protein